ncbi:MAG: dienelactone hydrolase family protein [Alphaproteobacteria bacterium]|nr:dienelactone hydrolase family protein [Alphaproteobacteria bacterium]
MPLILLLLACDPSYGVKDLEDSVVADDSALTADDSAADDSAADDSAADDSAADDSAADDSASGDDTGEDSGEPWTPPADPERSGPYSVDRSSDSLTSAGASVSLELFTPQGAGPAPVVILTHGFSLSASNYLSYGEHLASWGYVVVLPTLPGSAFNPRTHAQLAGDLSAVLDHVTELAGRGGALEGLADLERVGLSGHSMGGKVSLLFAAQDARPDAAFLIDPVDAPPPLSSDSADYPSVTPERMPDISIPLGFVGETTNGSGSWTGQDCAPLDENFEQYFDHAASPALLVEFLGASHMSFLDDPNCGLPCWACPSGSDDPAVTLRTTRGLMTAFFQLTLAGEADYAWYLTGDGMQSLSDAGLVLSDTRGGFGE